MILEAVLVFLFYVLFDNYLWLESPEKNVFWWLSGMFV